MTTPETIARRFLTSRRSASVQRLRWRVCGRSAGRASVVALMRGLLAVADARIDDGVEQVDDQVGRGGDESVEEGGAHDHAVVAREDGLDEGAADAGDGEELLDDEGAGDEA